MNAWGRRKKRKEGRRPRAHKDEGFLRANKRGVVKMKMITKLNQLSWEHISWRCEEVYLISSISFSV